jgi:copper(I)-binding protein
MTLLRDPRFIFGLLFIVFVVRPCCAAATDITVTDAWVRATIGQAIVTAGYVTIANTGETDDRLLSVRAEGVAKAEVHRTTTGEGGIMRMRLVAVLEIPAGEKAVFKGGGDHLMLTGIATPLKEDEEILLTLTFEHAGEVAVVARVARRDPFP